MTVMFLDMCHSETNISLIDKQYKYQLSNFLRYTQFVAYSIEMIIDKIACNERIINQ